jgi:hypothetical protein
MDPHRSSNRLQKLLFADAAICVAFGLLIATAATPLGRVLEVPSALLFYAGLALLPTAAYIAFVATRATHSPAAVWGVVAGNLAWTCASFWILLADVITPNLLGVVFVSGQAVLVLILAALEARGLAAARSWVSA